MLTLLALVDVPAPLPALLPDAAWPGAVDSLAWLDGRLLDRVTELLMQLLDGVSTQRALHAQVQDDNRRCRPWTAWGVGYCAGAAPGGLAVRGLAMGLAPGQADDAIQPVLELCPAAGAMQAVVESSPEWQALPGTGGWYRTCMPPICGERTLRRGDLRDPLAEARVRLGAVHAAAGLASTCRGQGRPPPVRPGTELPALRRAIGDWLPVRDALAARLHRVARRLGGDAAALQPDGAVVRSPAGRALHLRVGWALDSLRCEVVGEADRAGLDRAGLDRGALDRVADAWLDREDCPVLFQPLLGEVGLLLLPDESTWQDEAVEDVLLDLGRAALGG